MKYDQNFKAFVIILNFEIFLKLCLYVTPSEFRMNIFSIHIQQKPI